MINILTRNGAVSFKTRENICFVIEPSSSSESMDRYLTVTKQKTPKGPRTEWLEQLVSQHKKVFIWGRSGIGKTWTAKSLGCTVQIYDDDDDFSVPPNVERVVYIGNVKSQCPEDVQCFEYIPWTEDEMDKWLGRKTMRDLEGSMDLFEEPIDIATRFLKKDIDTTFPDISERGFVFAVVYENHDSLDPEILEAFSNAELIDTYIYKNSDWNMTPYFVNEGIIRPSFMRSEPCDQEVMRPGSIWTKHLNMCMRKKRLSALYLKGFSLDYLPLLRDYMNIGEIHPSLESSDLDIINHVCKIKKIHILKRRLKKR